jgi:hypothetical protein
VAMTKSDALLLQRRVFAKKELVDQFEVGTPLHDLVDNGTDVTDAVKIHGEWEGEYMVVMQRTKDNPNPAIPMSESAEHAKGGKNTYQRAKYSLVRHNQTFDVSSWATLVTRGGVSSVDDLLSVEMDGQISAARKQMSKYMHGDGSGMLGDVAGSGSNWDGTSTLTVQDASAFVEGQEVVLRGKQTGTYATNWPVSGSTPYPALVGTVDQDNNTIVLTDYLGNALVEDSLGSGTPFGGTDFNSYGIYPYDSDGIAKAIWGLGIACSATDASQHGFDPATTTGETDNFGGIKRTSVSSWQATVYTATALGGSTTPSVRAHIKPILNRIEKNTGGDVGWLLGVTGWDVFDSLADELTRQQRTNFRHTLQGGYDAIKIQNLYIVVDQDATYTALKIFEPDSSFRVIAEDWHIDETGGDMWNRLTGILGRGKQEFATYWLTTQQWLWGRCLANAQITGFNASM